MTHLAARADFAQTPEDSRRTIRGQKRPSLADVLESLYVIFALVYLTSTFVGLFTPQNEDQSPSPGTVGELALQTFVYLTAGIFILRHWRSFLRGMFDCKWAVALVALAMASALWAPDPLFVIRKGLVVAATTMFGIYFGTRYTRGEQVALLCWAVGTIAIMSTSMVVFYPEYGIDQLSNGGGWRGVFATKNAFARVMVLGVVALCCAPTRSLGSGALRLVCLVGFGALTVLSGSQTALVTGVLLLALTMIYRSVRLRVTTVIPLLIVSLLVFVLIVIVAIDQQDALLGLLGRDATFTGRVPLWDAVLVEIGKRPLLGYGFASFWNDVAGPSASVVADVGWFTPHAHNGFLDLCLDLGLLGLLTFGIGFVLRFRSAILEYRASRHLAAMWPFAFLAFLLLYNLTESTLLRTNSLYWALFTASLVREVRALELWDTGSRRAKYCEIEVDECPA